ncbi:hypothetical protein A3740_19445 [Oleiphilus sp. HI0068]|uniref:hypothetical protein n=1 Tax=unclassified Oleiphilus TaxID=2631174 RepID=UPI0007C3E30F|nr:MULTISPECIES: hypothetical protein [unclassified Oleiphilus]KZY57561.1 hypothetical protein A3735_18495 [Oleiphilus sp. HI0061]KZY73242.1 hypothetical protein A3740_19445 [Oleiphilus sp. HI0068]KZY81087.1 hypothetical protein A3741_17885 [Oleiphilus sp. HI0069]KZZ75323.1 hypothetical protein A3766_17005 [Oleiphilus sp. HI0132]
MERFKFAKYQRDWYIFDDKYRLSIHEDYLSIDSVNANYKEIEDYSQRDPITSPHIIIPVGAYLIRQFVIGGRCPIKIELSGNHAGSLNHNRGYDIAASGALSRSIEKVCFDLSLSSDYLVLKINGLASPIKKESTPIKISGSYAETLEFNYVFNIAFENVSEILNMNHDQLFKFNKTTN